MQRGRLRFLVGLLPLGFFTGCATTSPKVSQTTPEARAVIGAGTEDDRAVIDSTNQRFQSVEHEQSPGPGVTPNGQSPNLP